MFCPESCKTISRCSFLRTGTVTALTGILTGEALESLMGSVDTNSSPLALRITVPRVVNAGWDARSAPLIHINTNQGIYGLGEFQAPAGGAFAFQLRDWLLGEKP